MLTRTINPVLDGPVSPTPAATVYPPRLFAIRVWLTDETLALAGLEPKERKAVRLAGVGLTFKAPYGLAVNAADILARACARRQILRYTYGAASKRQLRNINRELLQRPVEALSELGRKWQIDFEA